jgi:hypothetical protein
MRIPKITSDEDFTKAITRRCLIYYHDSSIDEEDKFLHDINNGSNLMDAITEKGLELFTLDLGHLRHIHRVQETPAKTFEFYDSFGAYQASLVGYTPETFREWLSFEIPGQPGLRRELLTR